MAPALVIIGWRCFCSRSQRSFWVSQRRRKPAYAAYGWDFYDSLPNSVYGDGVRLEGRSGVVINVRPDTVIRGKEVSLEGEAILEGLHLWSELPALLEFTLVTPSGKRIA